MITHNVGEQFRSPTVNLIIYEDQFLAFCRHLKEYSTCPVEQLTEKEAEEFRSLTYPIGKLRGGRVSLPDINLFLSIIKLLKKQKKSGNLASAV